MGESDIEMNSVTELFAEEYNDGMGEEEGAQ